MIMKIPGECRQVLDCFMYEAYSKAKKQLSLSDIVDMTGIKKPNICRAISRLVQMNIIIKQDNKRLLNIDTLKWKPLSNTIIINSEQKKEKIKKEKKVYQRKERNKREKKSLKTISEKLSKLDDINIPYKQIISRLNMLADTEYRHTSKNTQKLIKARWNEGYRLPDFYYVIKVKTLEWLHDNKYRNFLRPETLFGTKFESYRNQKLSKKHQGALEYLKEQGAFDA